MTALGRRLTAAVERRAFPGLPPATSRVRVRRDLVVPMSDGTPLLADLHLPDGADPTAPTLLMRTPYGRRGVLVRVLAQPLAARGYPVLVQSCRGTFGSGGVFTPQVHERDDGTDTLRWLRAQPWCTPQVATLGASYVGYTQWAVAGHLQRDEPPTAPDALCLQVTSPDFGRLTWDEGAFGLRNALGWTRTVSRQERRLAPLLSRLPGRVLGRGFDTLPLAEADRTVLGHPNHWFQDWVRRDDLRDPYWTGQSHTASVPEVTAPVSMVTGWYDIFLPWQVESAVALAAAGNQPQLTIGPWGHTTPALHRHVPGEVHAFLRERLGGAPSTREHAVRVYVTGAEQWQGCDTWPPAVGTRPWALQPGGGLSPTAPADGPATTWVYDPADPTPALGGPSLLPDTAPVDNTAHEQRADVRTFTSAVLDAPLEVQGTPTATVHLRCDRPCTDVFVRLTDVHPDGRSMTVCDGIRRVGGRGTAHLDPAPDGDGVREITVRLWPTAHRFLPGHRLRVQVSSGAHPRYARNTGGTEPAATARTLHRAHQELLHGPAHPSRVELPVVAW